MERVHGLLIYAMSQKETVVLRQLANTKTEEVAFGRFVNNAKVTPEGILSHYHHVDPVDFIGKHILVVQDSSSAAFGLHSNRDDLGYVGTNTNKTGFDMHPAIMAASDGACYGLGALKIWKRAIIETEEKESYK